MVKKSKTKIKKPGLFDSLIRVKRKILVIFLMVVFLAAIFYWWLNSGHSFSEIQSLPVVINSAAPVTESCRAYNSLDGRCLLPEQENSLPVAVMVDNFYQEAPPPRGLNQASIVYETLTESNITRLLAIYSLTSPVKEIGPVRSARPYFVDWAEEWGGLYLHCGGSDAALKKLDQSDRVVDVNEFYHGEFFWRDEKVSRPHNIFTSTKLVEKYLLTNKRANQADYQPWSFVDEAEVTDRGVDGQKVIFNYSSHLGYQVEWRYNQSANLYYRYQGGTAHQDADGKIVTAQNIIFQFTNIRVIDSIGRKKITTLGRGDILLFKDGQRFVGYWQKSEGDKTKFFLSDGSEVKFNRGVTWVEVVPIGLAVEVK